MGLGTERTSSTFCLLTRFDLKTWWSCYPFMIVPSSFNFKKSVDSRGSSMPSSKFEWYFDWEYFETIFGPIFSVDFVIAFHFSTIYLFSLLVCLIFIIDQAWVYVAGCFPIPNCFVIVPNFFIENIGFWLSLFDAFCFDLLASI